MYPHIISKLNRTAWAATPQTIESIRDLLNARMSTPDPMAALDGERVIALPSLSHDAKALLGETREQSAKPYQVIDSTAIVPVFGVIGKHLSAMETYCGGLNIDDFVAVVDAAVADAEVDQVVAWFHTPGGTVTGLPEAARALSALAEQKPVYAYTDGMCCSAGYYLASQCTAVFSSPSSDVGSIGVYLSWINSAAAATKAGLKLELFKAGEFKAMGHPLKELAAREGELLQAEVDEIWDQFKTAVTSKRPQVEESTMQGQTFSYAAQLSTGLVDAHYDSIGALLAELAPSEL